MEEGADVPRGRTGGRAGGRVGGIGMLQESRERCFSRATALAPASRSSCRHAKRDGCSRERSASRDARRETRSSVPRNFSRRSRRARNARRAAPPRDASASLSPPPSPRRVGRAELSLVSSNHLCPLSPSRDSAVMPRARTRRADKERRTTADGASRARERSPSRRRAARITAANRGGKRGRA